jgi:hypothetical protein
MRFILCRQTGAIKQIKTVNYAFFTRQIIYLVYHQNTIIDLRGRTGALKS